MSFVTPTVGQAAAPAALPVADQPCADKACTLWNVPGMYIRSSIGYDGMHTIAGNVKSIIFVMLGLLPSKPTAQVLQYDLEVNGKAKGLMVLSEFGEFSGVLLQVKQGFS